MHSLSLSYLYIFAPPFPYPVVASLVPQTRKSLLSLRPAAPFHRIKQAEIFDIRLYMSNVEYVQIFSLGISRRRLERETPSLCARASKQGRKGLVPTISRARRLTCRCIWSRAMASSNWGTPASAGSGFFLGFIAGRVTEVEAPVHSRWLLTRAWLRLRSS